MSPHHSDSLFETWLSDQPDRHHELARAIRDVILSSGHDYTEGVKWGAISYWLPSISRRTICHFTFYKDYARLEFFNGAHLDAPQEMLEGTGKKLRHIKIRQVDDSNRDALKQYIRRSTELAIQDPDSLAR